MTPLRWVIGYQVIFRGAVRINGTCVSNAMWKEGLTNNTTTLLENCKAKLIILHLSEQKASVLSTFVVIKRYNSYHRGIKETPRPGSKELFLKGL